MTIAIAPPFALELVTRRWRRRGGEADLCSVRTMLVGAEQIRPEVLDGFAEVFEPLGLRPDARSPDLRTRRGDARGHREARRRSGSAPSTTACTAGCRAGAPIPGVEVRLDPETGELLTRTPALMTGYLDDPEATEAAFDGDWLHTGDVAADRRRRGGDRRAAQGDDQPQRAADRRVRLRARGAGRRGRAARTGSSRSATSGEDGERVVRARGVALHERTAARSCSRSGPGSPTRD